MKLVVGHLLEGSEGVFLVGVEVEYLPMTVLER